MTGYFNDVYFVSNYFTTPSLVNVNVGDSGSGVDAAGPSLPMSDAGSGVESEQYGPSLLETGVGDDSKVTPGPSVLDALVGVDVEGLGLSVSDAGAELSASPFDPGYFTSVYFTTLKPAFAIGLLIPEAGSGSEVSPAVGQSEADTGQGVDASTEGPSIPDSGIGLEVQTTSATFTIGDLGVGVDIPTKGFWVFDLGAGGDRFAIRVLRSGRLQYTVRLRVTESVFDPAVFDPYSFE